MLQKASKLICFVRMSSGISNPSRYACARPTYVAVVAHIRWKSTLESGDASLFHAQGWQHVAFLCLNGGRRRNMSFPNLGAATMRERWFVCQRRVVRNAVLARARRVHQETELQRHRGAA